MFCMLLHILTGLLSHTDRRFMCSLYVWILSSIRAVSFQNLIWAHTPLDSPPTVDFDQNITQYQFNTIQSTQALKRKRGREKLHWFNTRVSLAVNSTAVAACGDNSWSLRIRWHLQRDMQMGQAHQGVAVQFVCSLCAFHPLGLLCGLHLFSDLHRFSSHKSSTILLWIRSKLYYDHTVFLLWKSFSYVFIIIELQGFSLTGKRLFEWQLTFIHV